MCVACWHKHRRLYLVSITLGRLINEFQIRKRWLVTISSVSRGKKTSCVKKHQSRRWMVGEKFLHAQRFLPDISQKCALTHLDETEKERLRHNGDKVKFTLTLRVKFVQYLNHKTLQELVRQWERQYAVSHCLHAANSTNTIFSEEHWADRNLFSSKLFISSLWGSDKVIGIIIQTSTVTFRGRVGADRLQRRCVFLSIEVKEYLPKGAWEFTFVLFNAKKYQQVEKQHIRKCLNGRCWEG